MRMYSIMQLNTHTEYYSHSCKIFFAPTLKKKLILRGKLFYLPNSISIRAQ